MSTITVLAQDLHLGDTWGAWGKVTELAIGLESVITVFEDARGEHAGFTWRAEDALTVERVEA